MFISYYTSRLWLIGILGLGIYVAQHFFGDKSLPYILLYLSFAFILIMWTTYAIFGWLRKEKEFAIRYG